MPESIAVVHNTDIGYFKRCRQLWEFTSPLQRNLEPARPVEPLAFGTIWHEALATYYGGSGIEAAYAALTIGFDSWENTVAEAGELSPEDEEMVDEHRSLAHGMLDNYLRWAPVHATPPDSAFKVVWVERPFKVELAPGIVYGFKPDGLVEMDGRLWLKEHKSGKTLPTNTDYLLTDDQVGRYLWGIEQATGEQVEGVIYTVSRKGAPKPPKLNANGFFSVDKRQLTTYDLARDAIVEHHGSVLNRYAEYLAYLKEQGYSNFFFREPVRRNRAEIENIGRSLVAEAQEMVNNPNIYRTSSAFNCNGCSFIGPCIAKWSGQDYELALKGNYVERKSRDGN